MRELKAMLGYWSNKAVAFLLATVIVGAGVTRAAPVQPVAGPFEAVLNRIRDHVEGEEWKKPGWNDPQITAWLDKMTTPIIQAAGLPTLKIPVGFADVRPTDPAPHVQDGLLVGRSMKLGLLRRSIVLCDGDVKAERVEDSVIIASGSILIGPGLDFPTSAERSVCIAGTYIYVDISGKAASITDGNVIVSRGWADALDASGTAFVALEGISVLSPVDSAFINADYNAVVQPRDRKQNHSVRVPDLSLGRMPLHPLSLKIEYLGGVYVPPSADAIAPVYLTAALAFRFDGTRYVAMIGKLIVDEAGKPVEAFRGWRLKHVIGDLIAIFDTGGDEAVVRIKDVFK
jgi:hypothetical protein